MPKLILSMCARKFPQQNILQQLCNLLYQWRIQDFPEEGAATLQGGRQHTILPNFPKNCMKLKEFGPPGGGARVQNFTM